MKPAEHYKRNQSEWGRTDNTALGKFSRHFGLPLGQEWRPVIIVDRFTTLTRQEAGRSPTIRVDKTLTCRIQTT